MKIEFPLLTPDDIEVKVKQITAKGAVALLYKTARVDMEMLDRVVGCMNWQRESTVVNGNLYCTISIWDEDKKETFNLRALLFVTINDWTALGNLSGQTNKGISSMHALFG